ncbi:MAG: branched-chain amino acid ABC transporter permease [Thermoleophilia bacterium]|nr:branched-chain amino acid ABC transporter permease [Thermoleophilia bacterium]
MDGQLFAQQVVSGLANGAVYASLALALVLIYRTTHVVNFAQGEMAMFTTFVAWSLNNRMSYWPAFVLTLAFAFVFGAAIERVVIRPVEQASHLTVIMVTIALFVTVNGFVLWVWTPDLRDFPTPFTGEPVVVAGVFFARHEIGIIALTVATVVVLWAFFRFTKLGLAMRAAAIRPEAARLLGVRVGWMLALGWGFAAVLGAIAGMMTAPLRLLDPNMMQPVLIYAFAAAVLGGIASPAGAVIGGFTIGVGINLLATYVDFVTPELELPVAFAVLIGILLFRPAGIFGRVAARRV